jgi:acyl-CoA dehydrogenase
MEFAFKPEELELKKKVRDFAQKKLIPHVEEFEKGNVKVLYRLAKSMGEAGLFKVVVPKEYGGYADDVSCMAICLTREELAKGYYFAGATVATQSLGAVPINLFGTGAQKEKYLSDLGRGKKMISFCLTEPEAGSDVSNIQTSAVKEGDYYVLNGQKRFASNAGLSNAALVFAKTDPDKGSRGISAFIVEADTPGLNFVRRTPILVKDVLGEYALDNCKVHKDSLVGGLGEGFLVAMKTLDVVRPTVGAHAIGLAQAAFDRALAYAQSRRQFGQSLAEMQATQMKLAQMAAELTAARLLVYQAAMAKDTGDPKLTIKSSIAKLYATEVAQGIVDQAVQIHGGNGVVVGEYPLERFYREIRAPRVYEGTSEIQKIVIARRLLRGQSIEMDM